MWTSASCATMITASTPRYWLPSGRAAPESLTGLHNRRALLAHLDARLAAGQPGPVSALFFDLDRLKAINDYLGHTAGDWFIRVLAERLRDGADGPNLIARLGGDEFVVVPAA